MAARRINVFFYCLFMDAGLLRAKGANPLNIRLACVPGYALRIGQRAILIESDQERADPMLMELTHDEIELLYSEASVSDYRPKRY